ncbi:hypothetical protein MMP61_18640 [Acinetobacter sp. NIPH 1958]|uniref:hypothetical protein n=1 Tax=Acinetobacter sp. NIPH 1958 TaxID=2923430 RepID=UPI001F4BBA39|nr:hypothetical protein [Acinetobacter sp. NIPH 1958]MCH7357557.1 hypothetical protein [Acinetobacter sp. NIPH 1958]
MNYQILAEQPGRNNGDEALSEINISLQEPVRFYTAKELAVMPLSKMLQCRDEQEEYYVKSILTLTDRAKAIKTRMENGELIKITFQKKRVHTYAIFSIGGSALSKRIINQLAHRKLIRLPCLAHCANG